MNKTTINFYILAFLFFLLPVVVFAGQIPGDFNGDGKVDIYDFSVLLSNWKTVKPEYDLSGNGLVDVFDLSILLSNWTNNQ